MLKFLLKETQHKFIETQHELQEMMNSLVSVYEYYYLLSCGRLRHARTIAPYMYIMCVFTQDPSQITAATGGKQRPPDESFLGTDQQLVYDSLNPQLPLYSVPNKKRKEKNTPTPPPPLESEIGPDCDDEEIYDSVVSTTTVDETPPPIPMKRIPSDSYMPTSSPEHSPRSSSRRRRHSSGEHEEHRHGSHHRSRKHSRRHSSSSRRSSECHCHCYDDQSPERFVSVEHQHFVFVFLITIN